MRLHQRNDRLDRLVIPHLADDGGAGQPQADPLSAVLGAAFLLLIDTLARVLTSAELPLSILTGLIGALFISISC